jgi:hypothetical protein
MSTHTTRPTNGVSYGYKHTVTSTDVSDGSVIIDFQVDTDLVANFEVTNSNGLVINPANGKLTYPAEGQVKIEPQAGSGTAEVSTVTTIADSSDSLSGTYFSFYSGGDAGAFYAWLDTEGIAEVSSVDTVADVDGSIGGIDEVNEISSVDTVADSTGSLNDTYFLISSTTVDYYVWFNVNSAGSDPSVTDRTGVEVALATNATADTVASAIETALEGLGGGGGAVFDVAVSTNELTITHTIAGACTDVADGTASTGFTIAVDTQGVTAIASKYFLVSSPTVDYYVWYNADTEGDDPSVGGRTGIEVAINKNDSADTIATLTETALEAVGSGAVFDVAVSTNEMTITNLVRGVATDAGAGTSGFTVATDTAGVAKSTDPSATGTGIEVPSATDATANQVAFSIATAINANANFGATATNNVVTITNSAVGETTDIADGDTGFAFAVVTEGVDATTEGDFVLEAGQIISVVANRDSSQYTYS